MKCIRFHLAATLLTVPLAVLAGCGGPVPPGSSQILLEANQAYEQGQDEAVIALCGRFLGLHPKAQEAGEAHYLRGLVCLRQGDLQAGQADLQRAIDLTGRDDLKGRSELTLAYLAEARGDLPAATEGYLRAADRLALDEPLLAEAEFRLGTLYQRAGLWEQADLRFDRITYLFPESPQAFQAGRQVRARGWTIQVGGFQSRAQAEHEAQRLTQANLSAEVVPALQGELTHVVLVGQYADYDQALEHLPEVRQESSQARLALRR